MKWIQGSFRCRRVERILLRADSGEASPEELARARKHLERCPKCRELEGFLRFLGSAWVEREVLDPGPAQRERALRAALGGETKEGPDARPGFARPAVRWAPLTAGLAFCLVAAILSREETPPPQKETTGVTKSLEWSNGFEESLARVSGETAALQVGVLSTDRAVDPVGNRLSRIEYAVTDLRLSTEEPWTYSFEQRLLGVSAAAEDLFTNLGSF